MDQKILNQLLESSLELKQDVGTIKTRQEGTMKDHAETKKALEKIDARLDIVEGKINEAAMTWKITKRIAVGLVTVAISALSLNWAGIKAGWVLLFHG